jgi:hypothetical protein
LLDEWNVTFVQDVKKLLAKIAHWVKENGFVIMNVPREKQPKGQFLLKLGPSNCVDY